MKEWWLGWAYVLSSHITWLVLCTFYAILLFNFALVFLFNIGHFYIKCYHWLPRVSDPLPSTAEQGITDNSWQYTMTYFPSYIFFTKLHVNSAILLSHFITCKGIVFTFFLLLTSGLTATSNWTAWEHKKFCFIENVTCYVYKVAC